MQQNFSSWFRGVQIIFGALLTGQVMVGVVMFAVAPAPTARDEQWTLYLSLVLLALAGLDFWLFKNKIAAARALPDLRGKLAAYRTAFLLRCALLEAPVLLAFVVHFFVSWRMELLAAAALLVVVFALQRPVRDKLVRGLDLSMAEQMLLDDPNYIVAEAGAG